MRRLSFHSLRKSPLGRKRLVESVKVARDLQPDPWHDIGTLQFIVQQREKVQVGKLRPKTRRRVFQHPMHLRC
jgi:hypothetical protein